jgi:hypothetical protein
MAFLSAGASVWTSDARKILEQKKEKSAGDARQPGRKRDDENPLPIALSTPQLHE